MKRYVFRSFPSALLTMVLLTTGVQAPFGISSLAVFLMIVSIPFLATAAIMRRYSATDLTFVRHNLIFALIIGCFAVVAQLNGGIAYPSYLVSIAIHLFFFSICLLIIGAEGVWRSFRFAALVNVGFVVLQLGGGVSGFDVLVRLNFLGIMKADNV